MNRSTSLSRRRPTTLVPMVILTCFSAFCGALPVPLPPLATTAQRSILRTGIINRALSTETARLERWSRTKRRESGARLNAVSTFMGQGMDFFHIVSAGCLAGAIGIGAAYPFDMIKTQQVLYNRELSARDSATSVLEKQDPDFFARNKYTNDTLDFGATRAIMLDASSNGGAAWAVALSPSMVLSVPTRRRGLSAWDVMVLIFQKEGVGGFFGGVQVMMISQAIIKALTFTTNALALENLHKFELTQDWSDAQILFLAAACAGFLASFVIAPMERICCLMQANAENYDTEWDCLQAVIKREGVLGWLFGSGWSLSVMRKMPSDMIDFGLYGLLMSSTEALALVPPVLAPLVFGAAAGIASWVPVYPVDVVKTLYQAQEDKTERSAWDITQALYQESGVAIFFEGIESKLIRSAVHHAVTFAVFDAVLRVWH